MGEYKFGPLFMRLCYELDLEDSAVELIKDQVTVSQWLSLRRDFLVLREGVFSDVRKGNSSVHITESDFQRKATRLRAGSSLRF